MDGGGADGAGRHRRGGRRPWAAAATTRTTTTDASSSPSAAAGGTIKVGFVNSATGVSAAPNQAIVGSTMGAIEQTNAKGGIDGKWIDRAHHQGRRLRRRQGIRGRHAAHPAGQGRLHPAAVGGLHRPGGSRHRGEGRHAGRALVSPRQGRHRHVQVDVQQRAGCGGQRRRAGQGLRAAGLEDGRRRRRRPHHPAGDARLLRRDGSGPGHHVHQAEGPVAARPDRLQRRRLQDRGRLRRAPMPTRWPS